MKKNILQKFVVIALLFFIYSTNVNAQCGAGYTRDTLNWNSLDFLQSNGSYSGFVTLAQSQSQRYTFGTQVVSITNNFNAGNTLGDDNTFTAQTGSYGNGANLRFKSNGTVTFTFQTAVQNCKFSIFDIDKSQKVSVSALNGATGTNVALSTLTGSILTINTNNAPGTAVSASSVVVANTDNPPTANGTLNVDITGPVTSFTITTTNTGTGGSGASAEDGSIYISSVSACSAGSFPMDYYNISKPYAGQPSYFLAVCNNNIYYINVANGVARFLFKDPGHTNINSLAYDPYRHMCYYSYSLTGSPSTDKTMRRYDYDLDTLGIFVSNINTIGIPTFESGIESGAAAFYDDCLFIGIEGTNMGDDKSNRESIVWKIHFTPTYGASTIEQLYGTPADDGNGTGLHDWGDIGINDGIMFDFDGAAGQTDFYHKNMLTGGVVHYNPSPSSLVPRQVSVDWTGKMYNSGSPSSSSSGTVAPYNENGTINTAQQYTMRYQGVAITGSWGDAGEAFKPKTDYGDAPASYDPPAVDPGTHERNDSVYLGTKPLIEWSKHTSADATGDGAEEDGVSGLQVITTGVSNFTVPVKAFNNTGRTATVVGWVDANGNGTFEASEGTSFTIPSSASIQNISLLWSGINCTLAPYTSTFMRIRIATSDLGMTTANMNGYFDNGEIEDYMISVSLLLPEQNVTLKAQKTSTEKVSLVWSLNQETNNNGYELQRSDDGISWQTITNRSTAGGGTAATYSFIDAEPQLPASYYRVKILKTSGAVDYSDIKKVDFSQESSISLSPNPANTKATLKIESAITGIGRVNILDYTGRSVYDANVKLTKGTNEIDLPLVKKLSSGMYKVRVKIDDEILVTTLVVMK